MKIFCTTNLKTLLFVNKNRINTEQLLQLLVQFKVPTSQEKLLEELGHETFKSRRWIERLLFVQNYKYWYTQIPYRSYS